MSVPCDQKLCFLYLTSAVVDTTEEGRLEGSTLLKPFKESGDFTKFGESGTCVLCSHCSGKIVAVQSKFVVFFRSAQLLHQCV